jgi:hypothetical protein
MVVVRVRYAKNGESRPIPMKEVLTTTLKAGKLQSTDGKRVFAVARARPTARFAQHSSGLCAIFITAPAEYLQSVTQACET